MCYRRKQKKNIISREFPNIEVIHQKLIIGGSISGKTYPLLNLINHHPDIDKISLYVKDPYEAKYQLSIKI